MTIVDPSSPKQIEFNSISVVKGDKLLFRVRSDEDGQQDLLEWNPQVTYLSPNAERMDANGLNYGNTNYEQAFLLSASEAVTFNGDQNIGVTWPNFEAGGFTDDVVLRINVTTTDTVTEEDTVNTYEYIIPAGTNHSPIESGFKEPGQSTPAFLLALNTVPGATARDLCQMTFEIWSTSNISWKQIQWRPEVQFGNTACGQVTRKMYPAVFYSTYNRVQKLDGPFYPALTYSSQQYLRTWPALIFDPGRDLLKMFTQNELDSPDEITRTAYLVTKSSGNLLSKMAIVISNFGKISYYVVSANGTLGAAFNLTSDASYPGFNGSEIRDNLFVGLFTHHRGMGQFLKDHVKEIGLYEIVDRRANLQEKIVDFNIFNQDLNELQDYYLHWGQFCWSLDEKTAIDTAELHMANKEIAEQNDYSDGSEPTSADMQALDTEALNPMNQKFFMLTARRGETPAHLRSYIEENYLTYESLDRWSAWGTHVGAYAFTGTVAPGKFGEREEIPATGTPITLGNYSAYGIPRKSKSYSLAISEGVAMFVGSVTQDNPSKYFSQGLTSFRDMNGDHYPDVLETGSALNIKFTNPTGGHKGTTAFYSDETISKTITDNSGAVVAGTFINEDPRFVTQSSVTGSVNFGENRSKIEWTDLNGDGLADRISPASSGLSLSLNSGRSLLAPVTVASAYLPVSDNFTVGVGGALGNGSIEMLKDETVKSGKSFSVGIGINVVSSEAEKLLIDLNGDGLADMVTVDNKNVEVWLNTGTDFQLYSAADFTNVDELNKNEALGISGSVAATYALTLASTGVYHVKGSASGNGKINYSVNGLQTSLMDMNGDGVLDYVSKETDDKLKVLFAQVGKSNLLKKVINPLKGSFNINYEREGNKYGFYPTQVKIHSTKADEVMTWDMPNSKWVMSELTLADGLDIINGTDDVDGQDALVYTFAYDGGIKSRREREFLGFTRIEKTHPANIPAPIFGKDKEYISEVTEYPRPENNDPTYRRRFEYIKSIYQDFYTLHHLKKISGVDPNPNDTLREYRISLMEHKKNEYEYFQINMAPNDQNAGQLKPGPSKEDPWVKVEWPHLTETDCIFPALISTETITVPQTMNFNNKYHAVKYELEYDKYMNVIEYSNEGVSSVGSIDTVITDTIINTHYEYHVQTQFFTASNVTFITGSSDSCYLVTSLEPGFPNDTVCFSGDLNPCDTVAPPIMEDFESVHRKLVIDTVYVKEALFLPAYSGRIIAQMGYFDPVNAASQTNMLKWHKIYLGTVDAAGLERHTEVYTLQNEKAPSEIWNYLNSSGKAVTNLTYDVMGNLTQVIGPANHASQRMTVNYNYDTQVKQFVVTMNNSYGDNACFRYDFATGNLLKTEDVNGNPMRYVYDDFYRLKEVWGPREVGRCEAPAAISFEYHPFGINPAGSAMEQVPVAFTNHGINGGDGELCDIVPGDPPAPTVDCTQLVNLSGRPSMLSPLQTATFMDGLQRVVQVKKDVSKENSIHTLNERKRQVSGMVAYDSVGRETSLSLNILEDLTSPLGKLNNAISPILVSQTKYDYANRPVRKITINEIQNPVEASMTYKWIPLGGPEYKFCTEVKFEDQNTWTFTDSYGRKTDIVQNMDGTTHFQHDALGQLKQTIDPLGQVTSYSYDNFGRMLTETHPDRGLSTYTYDMAGNLTKVVAPEAGTGITMAYHYNRLKTRLTPNTPGVNKITYFYGSLGDGKNGAGRVTQVVQGQTYKIENYAYDELGNLVNEEKIIRVPQAGQRTFNTQYQYDSWGRMQNIIYPDGDRVVYLYNPMGDLNQIRSINLPLVQNVVENILYDGFGNISRLEYGNGAVTTFDYNDYTRRMDHVSLNSAGSTLLNKGISYDDRGNVSGITNSSFSGPAGLGGNYNMNYTYDNLNRLETASGKFNVDEHTYNLTMEYNLAGGITKKIQTDENANGSPYANTNYNWTYNYNSGKKHQIESVGSDSYTYNGAGSVTYITEPTIPDPTLVQQYLWDEEQKLMAVHDPTTGIHHYTYDHNGERIMKTSLRQAGGALDGQSHNSYVMDPSIVYVNPYFVATHYLETVEASKHYYMGSQRVASALISYPFVAETPIDDPVGDPGDPPAGLVAGGGTEIGPVVNLLHVLDLYGKVEGVDYDTEIMMELHAIEEYDTEGAFIEASGHCNEEPACLCEHSRYWANIVYDVDCDGYSVMYWYHPDYLGNTEYITDLAGEPYQFFWYSPWGESLIDENRNYGFGSNYFISPYQFNGKELDAETGNYYYGARYYNPKTSIWLSVDPLASERSWLTPYNFVQNNPIMRVDPTGMLDWEPKVGHDGSVSYQPEPGDDASTLANQYGITQEQAEEILCGSTGTISGEDVHGVLGTDVLKLDLNSEMATNQRILDQWVFGVDYSKSGDAWAFESTDFYSNTQFKNVITGSGYISIDGQKHHITAQIPIYRPATFDGSKTTTGLGNAPYIIKQTSGKKYDQTDLILFDLYHPSTGNRMGQYRVLSDRKYSDQVYDRLQQSFPERPTYLNKSPNLKR